MSTCRNKLLNILFFFQYTSLTNILQKSFKYILPIYKSELPRFFAIALLMFSILSIQNLVRALKDSIVNTMIGAETISFLKFWGVMPAALLIMIIYVKLVSKVKSEYIFYIIISIFLGFFAIFAFYIFPNHEILHLHPSKAQLLIDNMPHLKWFILLLSNWSFSLFYIIAELWPNLMFALLFWQFVNMITSVEESRRFYPLFGLLGQTGLLFAGTFLKYIDQINQYFIQIFHLTSVNNNVLSIQSTLSIVLILGFTAISSFWVINHRILNASQVGLLTFKADKIHIGLIDSLKMVLSSRYILLIALMLVCYGVAINLVEGPWKAMASSLYTTPTEYAKFVGGYLSYIGVFTLLFTIIGSNIVRYLGWYSAAIITPIMFLVTGVMFFGIANFQWHLVFLSAVLFITDPVLMAVTIGAVQNVLSKSSKYTVFDSTKEMSYVPLDGELKTKGKAAADMVGSKLGKSVSALLQSTLFILLPSATYQSISIYLMIAFVLVCLIWIWCTKELDKEYQAAIKNID